MLNDRPKSGGTITRLHTWPSKCTHAHGAIFFALVSMCCPCNNPNTPIWGFMWCHIKQILQVIILSSTNLVPFPMELYWRKQQIVPLLLFSSYHVIKLQLSDNNISMHTQLEFQIFPWGKSKVQAIFVVFLHTALYKKLCKPSIRAARWCELDVRDLPLYLWLHPKHLVPIFTVSHISYDRIFTENRWDSTRSKRILWRI